MREEPKSQDLLDWYDRHARVLPWRTEPELSKMGQRPDPYHVWLSEIMLQQTTVAAVRGFFREFVTRWPTVQELAIAPVEDILAAWAGLGYYARARNLHKCAGEIAQAFGGQFPDDRKTLLTLPGIGPYTAAAISAIAFGKPETVVDGNVVRVMSRVFAVDPPLPGARRVIEDLAASLTPQSRPGDYAQAIMDLGAGICTARSPDCPSCPWQDNCQAHAKGDPCEYPHQTPKAPKPTRYGVAYLAYRSDGAWLLERRPPKGLLGGMLGWPGTNWGHTPLEAPPIDALWRDLGITVRHTFTHFHLELSLRWAMVPAHCDPGPYMFLSGNEFSSGDLPTLMRKAYDLVQPVVQEGVEKGMV